MASAVPLEKSVVDVLPEIKDIGEGVVYRGNRISAAGQFAVDVVRMNQREITDYIGHYLCGLTSINSFVYALFMLKYSRTERGYTFDLKPEDRLNVVG